LEVEVEEPDGFTEKFRNDIRDSFSPVVDTVNKATAAIRRLTGFR
jgi:hypothetical protein